MLRLQQRGSGVRTAGLEQGTLCIRELFKYVFQRLNMIVLCSDCHAVGFLWW